LGSHATPPELARTLVDLALDHLGRIPELVVDPSCGAGSFLLAAADALVDRGVSPAEVPRRLAGCDVDPEAVRHCRAALERWAAGHGVGTGRSTLLTDAAAQPSATEPSATEPPTTEPFTGAPTLVQLDPLRQASPFRGRADLVVGNPPFLAQRTSDTARSAQDRLELRDRFGALGGYADDAAVFLLMASELLSDGAVMVLVEPQSVLSTRDSAVVRGRVLRECDLIALWADDIRYFDAQVDVCAPVMRRRARARSHPDGDGADRPSVALHWGRDAAAVGRADAPSLGESWAPLLAASMGVPTAVPALPAAPAQEAASAPTAARAPDRWNMADAAEMGRLIHTIDTIGDVAAVTAGFRDEFYALAAAALVEGDDGWTGAIEQLVTVGMIDVCRLDLQTPRRLGGRRVTAPRLDAEALERDAPRVARWVQARRAPKVIVATQTKVIEAVADPDGTLIPVTPVLSVEPLPAPTSLGPIDVWHLLAVLSAPSLAAMVARQHAGSGLSMGSFRVSAATLRSLPLPEDRSAWADGADIAAAVQQGRLDDSDGAAGAVLLRSLGETMIRAYGSPDESLLDWWLERVPRRFR